MPVSKFRNRSAAGGPPDMRFGYPWLAFIIATACAVFNISILA
jgi:hypothetical protein